MFDRYMEWLQSAGQAWFYAITLAGGTAMLVLTGWLWWHYSYLNPQTVFWAAVNNNLVVEGVTKHTTNQDSTGGLDQYTQINLGAQNIVKSMATVTQSDPNGNQKSTVVTEVVGTLDSNYARYTKIEDNQKKLNFSDVLNVWSKQDISANGNGAFADGIFDVIPFAHLDPGQRKQVVRDLQQGNTYQADFDAVQKERRDGRLYYSYNLSVAPDKYIALLKQVDALTGLNQLKSLDASQYEGGNDIKLKITIDAWSHQLAAINYTGSSRQQTYSGWGAHSQIEVPTSSVSQAELQAKLTKILNSK